MATQQIQIIPPLDGNLVTGPTRIGSVVGRTLNPTPDVYYGEKMQWIYVGTTGNISYQKWDDTTQVLDSLQAGIWHPILSLKINSTGTTATNIVVGS
jgi:hypothetical protein